MIYYISDLHLGHANIIKLCNRPFADVDEMNATLIANWNARVTNGDTVYICGDLMFRSATVPELFLCQLRGKKHLIVGNHDSSWMKKVELSQYFESVENLKIFSNGKYKITLCHYPMMSFEGKYLIHGHIHNNKNDSYWSLLRSMGNALNTSVEINNYAPATFDELVVNNARFRADDCLEASLSPLIRRMNELAKTAYAQYAEITNTIIAGHITKENDIARQLDYMLDFCHDDECHKLYDRILDCIENKYPETAAFYRDSYDDMWGDEAIGGNAKSVD